MHYKARLIEVLNDQDEYADLIGREGDLQRLAEGPCFTVKGCDPLIMFARRVSDDGAKVVIYTKLDNRFTFKITACKA